MKSHFLLVSLVITLSWIAVAGSLAQPQEPLTELDEAARFLAGLPPLPGSPLESLAARPAWQEHAKEMEKLWEYFRHFQLDPIRQWSTEFLEAPSSSTHPVFYPFSGPDVIYPRCFFPYASIYVLASREEAGLPPSFASLLSANLDWELPRMRQSLQWLLQWSFSVTKETRRLTASSVLGGMLPLYSLLLVRDGCHLLSIERAPSDRGTRLLFRGPEGREQRLCYFSVDLEDGAISASGLPSYLRSLPSGPTLIKAASYLLHGSGFSELRRLILTRSTLVLQDDSGIPVRFFSSGWNLRFFGLYQGPIQIFREFYQPDLSALTANAHPAPLPFSFGYRWKREEASLIVATRTPHPSLTLPRDQANPNRPQ
ncbi:hypothetical protein [Methylacidimicrobium sp. B4]|uniref:hypothetical protein n=1 Tax=Methylacidimicrobium sp. B4 TaxID=2796139 RepID=UPI001A8C2039|nr:hypothetical protein [Methylacidimicrobium sp. B4]QSR84227.1 hypothetical protein MacB4_08305 [Methylacidimicrobium sp. B4]